MDCYKEKLKRVSDVLDSELQTKHYLHFKYVARKDKEMKLAANFYNSGIHRSDTSKLKFKLKNDLLKLEEKITNLQDIHSILHYNLKKYVPNSFAKVIIQGNLSKRTFSLFNLEYRYQNKNKLYSEAGFKRYLCDPSKEKVKFKKFYYKLTAPKENEENKLQPPPNLKKFWKNCVYENVSAELYSTPEFNLRCGFSAAVEFEIKGPHYLLPVAGVSYNQPYLSHVIEYNLAQDSPKWGLLNYLFFKRIKDDLSLAFRVSRNLSEAKNAIEFGAKNAIEFGAKYQPNKHCTYKAKIDDEFIFSSGVSFQQSDILRASIALQHDLKNFSKNFKSSKPGTVRSPIQFKVVFGA